MTHALRLYRATVVSVEDPEGLGRVRLAITRTIRGAPVQDEGWAACGTTPLAGGIAIRPVYAVGDAVLYAAERLPFAGASVLSCLARAGAIVAPFPEATICATKLKVVAESVIIDTALLRLSGTIQCDTIIANNVVGSSYTPGAGNIA